MYKIAIGGFSHETHTFLDKLTDIEDFEVRGVQYGEDVISENEEVHGYIKGFIDILREQKAEPVGTVSAGASVHGHVTARAFDKYTGEMVERLQNLENLDGVLLALHGAMAAENHLKAEAEVVRRVRNAVGDIPIMVTLDLHANEDHELTDAADAVFVCKKYPHTDTYETGVAASRCLLKTLRGDFKPEVALHKPKVLSPSVFQWSEAPPMTDFRQRADEWKNKEDSIYYISIAPGFGYADVPDAGASAIVVTDGDRGLAETVARDISLLMWKKREQLATKPILGPEDAVREAMESVDEGSTPVVLADGSDRTGDSTYVPRELLTQQASGWALSSMNDADAVQKCQDAGLQSTLELSIGGWGQASGEPLQVTGKVVFLDEVTYQLTGPMGTGRKVHCGPSAVLDLGDERYVVLTSRNHQVRDEAGFSAFGLDPAGLDILVVRSRVHFRAYYDQEASEIIEVDAPGMGPADLTVLDYENVPADLYPVGSDWR